MSGNMEELRRQILVGQFVGITGCASEQARQLLQAARWQFETALSEFFQETGFSNAHSQHQMLCTPANTPATPPNFPDALAMFSRLCTSDAGGSYAVSPVGPVPMSPHGSCASFWPPSPPEGSMHWVNPTCTWPPTSQQPSTHQTPPVALAADGKR